MRPKTFLGLLGFGATIVPVLVWGGAKLNKNLKYNLKMQEYEKLRDRFFREKQNDSEYSDICQDKDNCENNKQYFPTTKEDWLWEKIWKTWNKNKLANSEPFNVKNMYSLKNHCYEMYIRGAIDGYADVGDKSQDANKYKENVKNCTLSSEELKKLLNKS